MSFYLQMKKSATKNHKHSINIYGIIARVLQTFYALSISEKNENIISGKVVLHQKVFSGLEIGN